MEDVLGQIDLELPQGLPAPWIAVQSYSVRRSRRSGALPLPALLSQLLLAFTIEFDRESRVPLHLCATTLRVLGEQPLPVSDIPALDRSIAGN
jgi:hypothetical protein